MAEQKEVCEIIMYNPTVDHHFNSKLCAL